ncbi:oxidoreductase [Actinoplanes utahensis]|uniref:Oxidoreductase n=1 Tax=Actinoplanes utahensis TaxID=1869 RepID=A0A0A6US06_ACTUT|nr:oxidoreductase [Actinoplanes utahensis]
MTGRRMIVVGGSVGIGRGIADAWAAAGADVVVASRNRPADAAHPAWEPIDVTAPEQAAERLAALGAERVDAVCYSAIYYGDKRADFGDIGVAEWRRQLDVNVTGLWLTLQALLPTLRAAEHGLVLGVSSEVAFNAGPGRSGYAATKAAAKALLDSIAQEEKGLHVVQVLPSGMVDTPGIRRRRPPGFDYSGYARPDSFARVAVEVATMTGRERHGDSLVVDEAGNWWSAYDRVPDSQSRVPA